jgi:hypothetical protein
MSVFEMSAREIYDDYVQQTDPAEVLQMSRNDIASQLMVDNGLDQESAYYAADQILAYAQELLSRRSESGG